MPYITRKHASTSNILRITLRSSLTGQGLTGLTHSSTGLIISAIADVETSATSYTAAGSTVETVTTLGTYAAPTATKCRFKQVDATNHPGLYELQLADARFAVSGAKILRVGVSGAANLLTKDIVVQLSAVDLDDAVRAGLSALPTVAAGASGGLPTGDASGRVDVSKIGGTTQTARDLGASVLLSSGSGTGQISLASGAVLLQPTQTGVTIPTVTTLTDAPSDSSGTTTLLSRLTSGRATGLDNLDASVSSRLAGASYTVPDNSSITAIKAKTDNLPSDPADQSAVEAAIAALLTTQMAESYSADGTAPTLAQALFLIMQRLTEFSISSTTITIKKLDGTTTAATLTLDDANAPTSSTRAS